MKRLFLFSAAVAVLLSCAKESPVDENPNPDKPVVEYQTITFEAVVPTTSDCPAPAADGTETKTTLVNHSLVHWVKEDAVKVLFFPNSDNGWGGLTMDKTQTIEGANGVLTAILDEETAESCYFHTDSWSWITDIKYMYNGIALYPSTVNATSSRASGDSQYTNTEISYNLKTAQTAVENSFENGLLFSYAPIDNKNEFEDGSAKLAFENACALIKLNLPDDASDIVSVKVASSGTALTGNFKVKTTTGSNVYFRMNLPAYPLSMTAVSGTNNVTLSAPDDETLEPGGTYYIVAWPGTHSNGLTFTFTNTDGRTVEKSILSEVVLEKSKIDEFTFRSITFPHVLETSVETITVQEEGSYYFDLTSSRDWVAECDSDWLYIFSNNSGTGSMTPTTIELFALEQTENKTETITIKAGDDEIYVTVNYEVLVPELSIERYESWSKLGADGSDFQFVTVKSNVAWTLSTDSDWLTLGTTSGNTTTGETVMLTAAENTTSSERTATLYLRDEGNTVEQTFTVTQEAGKKTSGYKVIGAVLPEDLQTGKYYVIANYGDPTRYWTVGDASNYDLTLTSGFNSDAYSNEFSIDHIFYVTEIYKNTGMSDTGYSQRVQIALFSYKSEKGMYYVSSTATYRFTNSYGIYLNLGARYTGEYGNDVDMRDNSRGYYISTPDASKITCSDSGFTGTGPRKWLIYEVQ